MQKKELKEGRKMKRTQKFSNQKETKLSNLDVIRMPLIVIQRLSDWSNTFLHSIQIERKLVDILISEWKCVIAISLIGKEIGNP